MTVDTERLNQIRLMRDYVGAALNVANAIDDGLLAALLADIEYTLTGRIAAMVSAPGTELSSPTAPARFTAEAGYGRIAARSVGQPRP